MQAWWSGERRWLEQAAVGGLLLLFFVFQSAVLMKNRSTKSLDRGRVKLHCCGDYVKGNRGWCGAFWVGAKRFRFCVECDLPLFCRCFCQGGSHDNVVVCCCRRCCCCYYSCCCWDSTTQVNSTQEQRVRDFT